MSKKVKQTYFEDCWQDDPNLKVWIGKATYNTSAYCKLCWKSFKLSNMGSVALTSHMNGEKHKRTLT